jgi:hypothetical protein
MWSISCDILPIRDHVFFDQAVLEGDLGQRLLELTGFGAQHLDLIGGRLAGGVAGEPLFAGLPELLAPSVVEVLGDPFLAAELGRYCPRRAGPQPSATSTCSVCNCITSGGSRNGS